MPLKLRSLIPAFGAALILASSPGTQALDLGLSVGGIDVGVSVGGDSVVGVDVGVGDADVSVGVGGSDGVSVDVGVGDNELLSIGVDLDGDGIPETGTEDLDLQLGQEGALKAVQSKRALPLEDILTRARLIADGEIIDAQLIQMDGILVYEIKVLGASGDVSDLYFYARSGGLVAQK